MTAPDDEAFWRAIEAEYPTLRAALAGLRAAWLAARLAGASAAG